MDYDNQEQSIDLKQLVFDFLKKWRLLLVLMIIGALLLGGYRALKPAAHVVDSAAQEEIKKKIEDNEKQQDALLDSKLEAQDQIETNKQTIASKENTIVNLEEQITNQQAYIESSKIILEEMQDLYSRSKGEEAASLMTQILDMHNQIQTVQNKIWVWKQDVVNANSEIKSLQNTNAGSLTRSIAKLEKEIDKLQEDRVKLEESLLGTETVEQPSVKKVILFAIVGAVLGAMVLAIWMFLRVLLSHKLQNIQELAEVYHFPVLGSLYISHSKHRLALDRWLDRLSGEQRQIDDAAICSRIAAQLRVQIPDGAQRVVFTGTLSENVIRAVCDEVRTAVPEDWTLCVSADPLRDSNAMVMLKNANVVLVEAKRESDTRAIRELMKLLSVCHAKQLGFIEI